MDWDDWVLVQPQLNLRGGEVPGTPLVYPLKYSPRPHPAFGPAPPSVRPRRDVRGQPPMLREDLVLNLIGS